MAISLEIGFLYYFQLEYTNTCYFHGKDQFWNKNKYGVLWDFFVILSYAWVLNWSKGLDGSSN
jgi:hypothetical protein